MLNLFLSVHILQTINYSLSDIWVLKYILVFSTFYLKRKKQWKDCIYLRESLQKAFLKNGHQFPHFLCVLKMNIHDYYEAVVIYANLSRHLFPVEWRKHSQRYGGSTFVTTCIILYDGDNMHDIHLLSDGQMSIRKAIKKVNHLTFGFWQRLHFLNQFRLK